MATFLDSVRNKSTINASSASDANTSATLTTTGTVPGTADNNAIQVIGGNKVDVAFVDALYAGGKLTAIQRESILTGGDPSTCGLNQYDLYYVTVGRLGSRLAFSALGIIAVWSASAAYTAGQIVLWTQPGSVSAGLYQAQNAVPVGTTPASATYWVQLAGPQQAATITTYSNTVAYSAGQIVIYQPPNSQFVGLYVCQVATNAGTVPTVSANWLQVSNPGPALLYDGDATNPALPMVAAAVSSVGMQTTPGAALTIPIPYGRRYRVQVFNPRPLTAGQSTPTDCNLIVSSRVVESGTQDINGNTVYTASVVLSWLQIGNGNNSAIAAVAAGTLACRVRVELL